MFDIIEIIIIAVLFFLWFVTGAFAFALKMRNTKLISSVAQLLIDKDAVSTELEKLAFVSNNSVDIENGFIKFLSESRDAAHSYIEDVQTAIGDLKVAMNSGDSETITVAYGKVMSFLPDSQDLGN